jgi:hypothetical protein
MVRGRPAPRGRTTRPTARRAGPEPDAGAQVDDDVDVDGGTTRAGLPPRRPGRWIAAACILLVVSGVLSIVLGAPALADPAKSRCTAARGIVEDTIEDDKDDNDAGLEAFQEDPESIDTVACDEIVPLAEAIPDVRLLSDSAYRTQAVVLIVFGIVQVGGGLATLRTRNRRARTIAGVGALMSILFPVFVVLLQIFGLVMPVLIIYGLYFSREAREVFGEPRFGAGRRRALATRPADDADE